MPFPPINFCLVCESVRQEVGGKLTILGFFGVPPIVDIGVLGLDQPVTITFIFGFGRITDANPRYTHTVEILNPDGSMLAQTPVAAPINAQAGQPGIVGFGSTFVPRTEGLRTIRLRINGDLIYENTLMIHHVRPQELAGMPGVRLQ
jgi:hypothetical protein